MSYIPGSALALSFSNVILLQQTLNNPEKKIFTILSKRKPFIDIVYYVLCIKYLKTQTLNNLINIGVLTKFNNKKLKNQRSKKTSLYRPLIKAYKIILHYFAYNSILISHSSNTYFFNLLKSWTLKITTTLYYPKRIWKN